MPAIESLLEPILSHASVRAVLRAAVGPSSTGGPTEETLTLAGLTASAKALVVAAVVRELAGRGVRRAVLVVVADNDTAGRLAQTTGTFLEWIAQNLGSKASPALRLCDSLSVLPAFDCSPYEGRSPHAEIQEERAVALWNLACGRTRALFAPLPGALGRFRHRSFYVSLALELKIDDEVNLEDLVEHLASVGYEAAEPVTNAGQYSVRGGIVDVFPPEAENPLRIEFFGDRVESLREFDPSTQRSRKPANSVRLLPLSESTRSVRFFARLAAVLARHERQRQSALKPLAAAGLAAELETRGDLDVPPESSREPEWLAHHAAPFAGWEFFVPLVEPHPNSLLSLLAEAQVEPHLGAGSGFTRPPLLIWDEKPERLRQLRSTLDGWQAAYEEVRDITPGPPRPEEVVLRESEFLHSLESVTQIALKESVLRVSGGTCAEPAWAVDPLSIDRPVPEAEPEPAPISDWRAETIPAEPASLPSGMQQTTDKGQGARNEIFLQSEPSPKFHGATRMMIESLRERLGRSEQVVIVVPTAGKSERLREIFREYEIGFESETDSPAGAPPAPWPPGSARPVLVVRGHMQEGVAFPEQKLLLLSDNDLFGSFDWGTPGRRERSSVSSFISDLSDLKVGDYVVHVDHGVGVHQGLRQLGVEGAQRDFMLIAYQEDAKLYVPLERLDLVEKYRSSEGSKPVLDRLGGVTWARTKSRVKRALRDMAQELLRLYAERKMHGGVAYSADTPWQHEFEDAFEFEETTDQLSALRDIKRDLENPQPMDRLLCGDVGYGKTEVAMRAAFKVAIEGRQVAVLAPTTVLAFQHHGTFSRRMAGFPLRIEVVSRFRSAAEIKRVLAATESGEIDILIGTHRLLSKDVRFRDLGLLIVDEEQRFGVAAKEKLKRFRASVDVLTMSATPIPRTLNMSLGGLRDLSVIETPPRGRLAIQTVVAPFSSGLVQAAIIQELDRHGQVYFVHNRVESIWHMAAQVQKLVPGARLGVAHGQMDDKELERVMLKFVQGEYDVLVSTVLIENGLDIPRANTLVVNHAERFGLADLYQLRGRVGRSTKRAYAYLLVPSEDTLTPIAKRRLAALKEFSDLGAGFRLAALDLELRGAGNLLGAEQHGHLNSVGLDLYLKMLEETVDELKGAAPKTEIRATLNLGLDIKIPNSYISDERQRLRMYKRISSLTTPEARADLEAELADRYGPLPASVANLFGYALLKSAAERLLVQSVERKDEEIALHFHSQAPIQPDKLKQFLKRRRGASFRPDGILRFPLAVRAGDLAAGIQSAFEELEA